MIMLFAVSYLSLWLIVLVLALGFIVLAKQIGTLFLRVPARRARMVNAGPDIGERIQQERLLDMAGNYVTIPASAPRLQTLLLFLSPGCTNCASLAPSLRALGRTEKQTAILLAGIGNRSVEEHQRFVKLYRLHFPYIDGRDLAAKYHVPLTPYALLIATDGYVISKGIVNHLEDLESILSAAELSSKEGPGWASPLGRTNVARNEEEVRDAVRER